MYHLTLTAVFHFLPLRIQKPNRISNALFFTVQRAITEQTIKLLLVFRLVTGKIFTLFILKKTVTVYHARTSSSLLSILP